MSIDTCIWCDVQIDTDKDVDCYERGTSQCLCFACRHREDSPKDFDDIGRYEAWCAARGVDP